MAELCVYCVYLPDLTLKAFSEGWGWTTAVTPHGEVMRKHRAFMHKFFQSPDTLNFLELQQNETYVMLNGILSEPKNYERHVRRCVPDGYFLLLSSY